MAPDLFAEITRTAERLAQKWGTDYTFDFDACFRTGHEHRQKSIMEDVYRVSHDRLHGMLEMAEKANLRSAAGPGAGDFLSPPSGPTCLRMDCAPFRAVLRARLNLPNAGHDSTCVHASPSATCNHRAASGTRDLCEETLDARGLHASTCKVGGGVVRWHNAVRDWLAKWLKPFVASPPLVEQEVQAWYDENIADVDKRRAVLDVKLQDHKGQKTYVDVMVTSADTQTPGKLAMRASQDGHAAAAGVQRKHGRYPASKNPGACLVPFVVEARGRLSPEALAFLKAMVPESCPDRPLILRKARRDLSVLVQSRLGDLLLSAEAGHAPP
jgi:hypothetical protein